MNRFARALALLAVGTFALASAPVEAVTITFDEPARGFVHGSVVNTQYAADTVLASISVTNLGGGEDLAVVFDTTFGGSTSDGDLLGPPWNGGNLPSNTDLGNALIIQENGAGCGTGVCSNPDDEGSRPAGVIELVFSAPVLAFGFDLIDVESRTAEDGAVVFHDGLASFTIAWADFEAGGAFDRGLAYGNNSANRIAPVSAADVGLTGFDRIEIRMGGSGAIDNLYYDTPTPPAPEPAFLSWLALGLLGAAAARARR